jgi:Ion channel
LGQHPAQRLAASRGMSAAMRDHPLRPAQLRRRFLRALWQELRVIWPIVSALLVLQLGLGMIIGVMERWPLGSSAYFTFVTGLTIGFGDLVPTRLVTRLLSVVIGIIGILQTGLVAAVGVRALQASNAKSE